MSCALYVPRTYLFLFKIPQLIVLDKTFAICIWVSLISVTLRAILLSLNPTCTIYKKIVLSFFYVIVYLEKLTYSLHLPLTIKYPLVDRLKTLIHFLCVIKRLLVYYCPNLLIKKFNLLFPPSN